MNWLEFLASVIGAVAWPIVFLAALLLLRKPLQNLLPFLQKLKYKEFELEFSKRVEEVSAEVAQELPVPSGAAPAPAGELETVARLAEISPRAAVLEAWRLVEAAAVAAARRLGSESIQDKASAFQIIKFLERNPTLDRSVIGLLRELRSLRNEASHAPDTAVNKSAALEYAYSAGRVAKYLKTVASDA